MNLEKLTTAANLNMAAALSEYRNCEEKHAGGCEVKSGRQREALHQSTNGLWLVIWKGKFACIINSKVEIAAIVHFDDDGNLMSPHAWEAMQDMHRKFATHAGY